MESELARQSLKPNRVVTDGAGIPVTFDEVGQEHTRQASTVGQTTDVDARRQAGDREVAGFKREPQPHRAVLVESSSTRGPVQSRGADVREEVEARRLKFDQKAEIVKTDDGTLESRRSLLKQAGKQAGKDAVSSLENAKDAVQDLLKKRD
jgi:conjugal transfer mating pair stabilization protein TraG